MPRALPKTICSLTAGALLLAACGSADDRAAIEKVVRNLSAALQRQDYAAACADYTPNIRAAMLYAGKGLAARGALSQTPTTCAAAARALLSAASSASQGSAPKFLSVRVTGNAATATYTERLSNGTMGQATATVQRVAGAWKVNGASELAVTHK